MFSPIVPQKSPNPSPYPNNNWQQYASPIPQIFTKQYNPYKHEQSKYQESPQNYNFNQQKNTEVQQKRNPIDENKSFLDGFDNNNSSLLNQQKNHARNLRGRLFNNGDPQIQKAKEEKMKAYRQELAKQMEADKKRKQKQKKDQQEEELRREKKFYQNIKIQAQQKPRQQKEGNAYYMMRTQRNGKKNLSDEKGSKQIDNFVEEQKFDSQPKIAKRAYNNKTSLGHSERKKQKKFELSEEEIREKNYEEERISKILAFQDNMLKKLEAMKVEIRNTSSYLQIQKEVERVRFKLKGKPVFIDKGQQAQSNPSTTKLNDFYSLPKRNLVKAPKSRYELRMTDLKNKSMNLEGQERGKNSRENPRKIKEEKLNDKNFSLDEERNPQQENEELDA